MLDAKLNPAQRAAVEHVDGPLLVLAGAGSGKTRVITHRIARLVELGHRPGAILAVSFTNKAAAEMGERMQPLVGKRAASQLWLSTFHSFGVRFLGEENRHLGYEGRFVIFDQGDALGLVRELLREHGLAGRNLDVMAILTRISLWKNAFLMPDEVKASDFEYDAVARELYPLYQEALASMHAVDFDDLVVAPARLLREKPELREKWQNRFRFLLIDEFQDTNKSQLELVRLLANPMHNVCVVGDDDQSIYGWRGAEVGNILDFERLFPGTTVVKLETNYRSREPIVTVANAVISQSKGPRHAKVLRSAKGAGPKVRVVALTDSATEAKFVVREIRDLAKGGDASPDDRRFPYKSCAILYRSNQQGKLLEEELRIGGVPYRMYGGTQFFDRKEVKDCIAYLRVVDNPRDELSLRRILNVPARGIGEGTLRKVQGHAARKGLRFDAALRAAARGEVEVPARAKAGIGRLFGALDRARDAVKGKAAVAELTERLLQDVGLLESLASDESSHGQRRRENVQFLMRSLRKFDADSRGLSLSQFLTRITLRVEQEEEEEGNQVTLSSLHSAKGLEFDVVFLIGVVEGNLPHSRTTDPKVTEAAPTDVEEERRLFYVGVTRAKELLYLSRPERRTMRGRVTPRVPSRFLQGFPEGAWEAYQPSGEKVMEAEEIADMASQILERLRG
ncbi:MAG TPA: 3'-5' exonuclease [Polyangiaceae bacterium LLY-WYZ-15_(1-7)]|nr:3'-5' exonuclease [Polyangiaceae bacterium LLY-WYZ-15_(1-7)]HJL01640.1 3'-5' exonuclease [Polyangiaceae bacterium LLY-WYZ-15_(1-7)]HJL08680.1 3'-5' exonuclease [Polyangiaceae bacterium LLY-WYZ-15_(1-7)]HJL24677.1 3'-5' exonuclease [Polyangiaceae bacterium LLY-WYZ-15_(1-7)]HJL28575.1 3'-5' exonuclease [Polyangiaceae bacterium LLY-WYZ-15_(1-7)]